jgi:Zn-dependent metalloprotease
MVMLLAGASNAEEHNKKKNHDKGNERSGRIIEAERYWRDLQSESPLTDKEVVEQWLTKNLAEELGLTARDGLHVANVSRDAQGHTYFRSRQTHAERRVVGQEAVVGVKPDGQPHFFLGRLGDLGDVQYVPAIDVKQARRIANLAKLSDEAPPLVYLPIEEDGGYRLAYEVSGFGAFKGETSQWQVYIDAETGEKLSAIPLIYHGIDRRVHNFERVCRELGVDRAISDTELLRLREISLVRQNTRTERDAPYGAQIRNGIKKIIENRIYTKQDYWILRAIKNTRTRSPTK